MLNEVILFLKISGHIEICSGILDVYLMGFEPENVDCTKLGVKQGTLFWVPLFWLFHPVRVRFYI